MPNHRKLIDRHSAEYRRALGLGDCPEVARVAVEDEQDGSGFVLRALNTDGATVGAAHVMSGSGRVSYIRVHDHARRCGVATRLYEAGARVMCERYGKPLRSDTVRSDEADVFWKKQAKKRRARAVQGEGWGGALRAYYSLRCPPPRSLA